MKKLMIAAAIVCAAACVNASMVMWTMSSADAVMSADGSGYYNGQMTIACAALDYNRTFELPEDNEGDFSVTEYLDCPAYGDYNFTLTAETATHTYLATCTGSWTMGSYAQAEFKSGTWTPVPEPTSGLLMLLGMAGLALKRKRA